MGLADKYRQRDLKLPDYRQALMDNIEKDLLHDDNVLAVFYGGSIGNENNDIYSDIDLRVVVKPEKLKEYIMTKSSRPENWGEILFTEDVNPQSIYTVVHFDCFVKVDTFYYSPEQVQPSVWLKNILIVKDTNDLITDIQEQSKSLSYKPGHEEFMLWRDKFFAYLHEAYRRAMRKEFSYAMRCVDNLRLSMAMAWYMDAGIQPNAPGDWAGYEGKRSRLDDRQLCLLKNWNCDNRTDEILTVLTQIVPEFKRVHHSICVKQNMKENTEWVDKVCNMVN